MHMDTCGRRDSTRRDVYTYANTRCGIRCNMCMHAVRLCPTRVVCALVRRSHDYLNITLRPCTHVYGMYSMVIAIFDTPRQSRKIFRHAAAADTATDKSDEGAVESRMQESIFCIRSVYPLLYLKSSPPFFFCLKESRL